MQKIHFLTFGTESLRFSMSFAKTKWRLADQAKSTGWFDSITVCGEEDVWKEKFWNENHDDHTRARQERKNAYWNYYWYKATLVYKIIKTLDDNDILVWLDAGCAINIRAKKRFYEYIDLVNKGPGFVGFGGVKSKKDSFPNELTHTKKDLLIFLNIDEDLYGTTQLASGAFLVKKNDFGVKLMHDWCKISNIDHFINEDKGFYPETSEFMGHRHDQSILSCLVKQHYDELAESIVDINEFASDRTLDPKFIFPFKAMRIKDHHWGTPIWNYPNDRDYTDIL